jgi:hypothetical protein
MAMTNVFFKSLVLVEVEKKWMPGTVTRFSHSTRNTGRAILDLASPFLVVHVEHHFINNNLFIYQHIVWSIIK